MSDASELSTLFPNLAPFLDGLEGRAGQPPTMNADGTEHGGVTDADVEAYFANRLNGPGPQFRSGVGAPAPQGGWEDGHAPRAQSGGEKNDREVPATPPGAGNTPPSPTATPPQPAEMPQPFQTEGDGEEDGDDDQGGSTPGEEAQSSTEAGGVATHDPTPPPAPVVPPALPPEYIDLGNGQVLPRSVVEAYSALDARIQADPQLQRLLTDYISTGQVPVATPPTPQPGPFDVPPSDLDMDDPAVRSLWESSKRAYESQQAALRETQEQLSQINASIMAQQQQSMAVQQQQQEALVNTGIANFKARMNLEDADTNKLRVIAARLNVLPSLLTGVDPMTGAAVSPDPIAAVERSLEIAYYSTPEYRTREVAAEAGAQRQSRQRKQKLGALSGSSGSVPRSTPAPTTPEGNRAAMLGEVAAMMNGTWTEGSK